MGLDMYLSARKYVSDYTFQKGEDTKTVNDILSAVGLERETLSQDSPGISVAVNVGYWRKVNSVHNWFVKNVQGGVDECQESYVTREQLEELFSTVALAIKSKNSSLLPPAAGFFFGSIDIDEWYWSDLEYTRDLLKKILSNKSLEGFDFVYQASW
jgi:hypothetical protein